MTEHGTFGGFSSQANDINDQGQIVVIYIGDTLRSFLWEAGRMTEIVGLGGAGPGTLTEARAINNGGHVVGMSRANGRFRAFLWKDGHATDLGTPEGALSVAVDINKHDQVVGWTSAGPRAFLWEEGRMTDLGNARRQLSRARGHQRPRRDHRQQPDRRKRRTRLPLEPPESLINTPGPSGLAVRVRSSAFSWIAASLAAAGSAEAGTCLDFQPTFARRRLRRRATATYRPSPAASQAPSSTTVMPGSC